MSSNPAKKVVMAAILSALAGISVNSFAATATGTANANVLTPIAITAGQTLEFGTFAANGAGTVTIAYTDGTRGATGGVLLVNAGSTSRAGTFNVTGTGNATFGITYPSAFNITNGANTMSVTVNGPTTGTLSSNSATFNVGGVVTVAANQAPGTYTGTYTMTVEYN